ncbi:MAG: PD-(D/E)XK nuclease family protein [Clostridia bacterium]|nr:PD-(D/E)XK nuclease family protein [Clostridia bacterium]
MAIYTAKTYFDCIDGACDYAASFGVSLDQKIVIFCEDKLTLSVESALVEKAGGAFGAEVLSFGRYATKLNPDRKTLSKEGSAMAVKKILSEKSKDLQVLGGLKASPSLAVKTSELIAQLKSAKVTPQMLFGVLDGCPENVARKLRDVATVFDGYEEFLAQNGLTDSSNGLQDALFAIEKDEQIKNARVIIVGYSSVTKQTCAVMEKLNAVCLSCDFFAVTGDNKDVYTDEFLNFAISLTGEKPMTLPYANHSESEMVLDGLYNPEIFSKVGLYSDKTHIFEGKSLAEEVDYVCSLIKQKVLRGGYRYKDIAIGVGNLKDYELLLERKLADYQIPFFADKKRALSSHPLCKLAINALRSAIRRRDLSEIKKVITSGLFIADKKLADKFIRLLTEKSVTVNSFIDGDDFVPQPNEKSTDPIERFNLTVISKKKDDLITFINGVPKSAQAEVFVEKIKDFTVKSSGYSPEKDYSPDSNFAIMLKNLQKLGAEEEIRFLESATKNFFGVLDEIKNILGKDVITAEEFLKILASGLDAGEISLIPEYSDCVYLSEIKNLRFKKYPCVVMMGLSGDVPFVKPDTALLLDGDISKLDALALSIEPKIRVVNRREKEATALAFASFEDSLTLTYSLTTAGGKATVRSEIVDYLENIFSSNDKKIAKATSASLIRPFENQSDEDDRASFAYLSLRPAMLSLLSSGDDFKHGALKDVTEPSSFIKALSKLSGGEFLPLANALVGKINESQKITASFPVDNYFARGNVSATTIETYYSCPYKCFIRYGVGVKDTVSADIRSLDFGNILHTLAEKFMPKIDQVKSEEECVALADLLVDEEFKDEKYSRFLKRADYVYSAFLTKKEGRKLCVDLYRQHKNSQFKPIGNEIWFAEWSNDYKPLKLLSKKGVYKLFGKADRLDKYKDYVRIIDYKTGNAQGKSADDKFYTGQNLQLYLYLNAFTANGDKPAGAYYYAVNDDFGSDDDKPPFMYGKTLASDEVLQATDPKFGLDETFTSDVIEAGKKITAKKGASLSGKTVSQDVLTDYMKYAKLLTEKAVNDVLDGVIIPSPYEKACSYCEFGSICGRDDDCGYRQRSVSSVNPSVISQAVWQHENPTQGEDANDEND